MGSKYTLIAAGVLICAGVVGIYTTGRESGVSACQNAFKQQENEALSVALQKNAEYERVINESKAKQTAILADFGNARDALDGLRDTIANGGGSSNPACADFDFGATTAKLLENCGERYLGMAKNADLHAADALTCVSAWEKIK